MCWICAYNNISTCSKCEYFMCYNCLQRFKDIPTTFDSDDNSHSEEEEKKFFKIFDNHYGERDTIICENSGKPSQDDNNDVYCIECYDEMVKS